MKKVAGFWLPDHEQHLIPFLESSPRLFKGPTYQIDKFLACLPHIRKFDVALDVGAHCGLWSRVLVRSFAQVIAFEPVQEFRACFQLNVHEAEVFACALGAGPGSAKIETENGSSGNSRVSDKGEDVQVFALDGFGIPEVDFIKIDCEGFEKFVVEGGEQTIRKNKPCVIVEQKKGMGARYGLDDGAAVHLLRDWGAQVRFEMSGDYCLSWPC